MHCIYRDDGRFSFTLALLHFSLPSFCQLCVSTPRERMKRQYRTPTTIFQRCIHIKMPTAFEIVNNWQVWTESWTARWNEIGMMRKDHIEYIEWIIPEVSALTTSVTSSTALWMWRMALYPAQMMELCSIMTTWASNIRPISHKLLEGQMTKPGSTSSSCSW